MPNSIITHLQNQPILADKQEKIVKDPAFKKCLSDYEIRLLYLPDVLRDIPWNLVNNKQLWTHVTNTDTLKNYQNALNHTIDALHKIVDLKSHYCLVCNFQLRDHFIPLAKDNVLDFIIYLLQRINLDQNSISSIKHLLINKIYPSLNFINQNQEPAKYVIFKQLFDLYICLDKFNWPSHVALNNFLKNPNTNIKSPDDSSSSQIFKNRLFLYDPSYEYVNDVCDLDVDTYYAKSFGNFTPGEYREYMIHSRNKFKKNHVFNRSDIMSQFVLQKNSINLEQGCMLSQCLFKKPIYINSNEYYICRDVTHFKLENYEYNQDKVKINSMIIIHDNLGIARICLYDGNDKIMFIMK